MNSREWTCVTVSLCLGSIYPSGCVSVIQTDSAEVTAGLVVLSNTASDNVRSQHRWAIDLGVNFFAGAAVMIVGGAWTARSKLRSRRVLVQIAA